MQFTATDEQVKQMACNAINASEAVGMGVLHNRPGFEFKPDNIVFINHGGQDCIDVDYAMGRMVKLSIHRVKDNIWEIRRGSSPRSDYQSWCYKYPSEFDLIASVSGVDIIN